MSSLCNASERLHQTKGLHSDSASEVFMEVVDKGVSFRMVAVSSHSDQRFGRYGDFDCTTKPIDQFRDFSLPFDSLTFNLVWPPIKRQGPR